MHVAEELEPSTRFISPRTAYVLTTTAFRAAPLDTPPREFDDGLVNLGVTDDGGEPRFRVVQVDVDSAGFSTIELERAAEGGEPDPGAGLASLRSAGVSIVRQGNALFLMDVINSGLDKLATILAGNTEEALFAEDLVRGYRVDIRGFPTDPWRSLHHRTGVYRRVVAGEPSRALIELTDEGFVQPSVVQALAPGPSASTHDPSAPNYVGESLFLWQGWSLAARRPGPEMPEPSSSDDDMARTAPNDVRLDTSFRAGPRTLPRLRFGRSYEFRLRLVDLVGGGLDSADADAVLEAMEAAGTRPLLPASDEVFRYLRFDVVPSPEVLPRIAPGRGATVSRVVLRSNHDVSADAYAQQHPQFPEYALSGERHVVPPKSWQLLAEAAGLFDTSIGTGIGLERTHALTRRAGESLGGDEVHPEPVVTAPYLPDPLAVGTALRDLPGVAPGTLARVERDGLRLDATLPAGPHRAPQSVVTVPFDQAWPDLRGFRIRLGEGSQPPVWDAGPRILSVFLPKGETRTINLSSHLAGDAVLELMGIWTWLVERLDQLVGQGLMASDRRQALVEQLRPLSIIGQSWMITPPRALTLVHAVQQPLEPPVVRELRAIRLPGRTYAAIDAVIGVHAATTGQLELRWTAADQTAAAPGAPALPAAVVLPAPHESTAAGAPGQPKPIATFDAAAGNVALHAPDLDALDRDVEAALTAIHVAFAALADAVNLLVFEGFSAEHLAAMREEVRSGAQRVPQQALNLAVHISEKWRHLAEAAADIEGWARDTLFDPPDTPTELVTGLDGFVRGIEVEATKLRLEVARVLAELETYRARHEFGDTKYRSVTYRAVATTRFGDCFPASAGDSPDLTRTSAEFVVDVLNTATPPRPRIAYIVPMFAWHREGTADEQGFTSERAAGGLRVYLEGPWFASGEGELLGVALSLTEWARDPLWETDALPPAPVGPDFLNAVRTTESVWVPDRGPVVTMAGFRVDRDEHGRHYCDIGLNPARSYFPFVRLALTRFQPNSIRGAESSPAVFADFTQLTPQRAVSVVPLEQLLFDVTVQGITHRSASGPTSRTGTQVRVSVQERIPGTIDDAGWIRSDDAVVTEQDGELWRGTVRIPNRPPGTVRLLIEEFEIHAMFPSQTGDTGFIERVVFAETVPI
jgi:hypothetical protein